MIITYQQTKKLIFVFKDNGVIYNEFIFNVIQICIKKKKKSFLLFLLG